MVINNWFEKSTNYTNVITRLRISQAEYLSLINSVKKVFPQQWVEKELAKYARRFIYSEHSEHLHFELLPDPFKSLPYNPVPEILGRVIGGYGPLVALIRLGQLIRAAENEPGTKNVFVRLRGAPSDYMSALFELEVLATFKAGGFSLKKPMEADGVDFSFEKNNKEILIEATHRGASWILDLVDEIHLKSFQRSPSWHSNRFIHVKLRYRQLKYIYDHHRNDILAVVEEIVKKIVDVEKGFLNGFDDSKGKYSISVERSDNCRIDFLWHDPTDLAYESKRIFKNKLSDKDKRKQLRRHPGAYCAVDMRSLMPSIVPWLGKDHYDICSQFLEGWLLYTHLFFKENPAVGGIFIWVRHVGRVKDLVVDHMDQNEIILVNAPHHLSEGEALQLFPFAKLTKDLNWYHGNADLDIST